MDKETLLQVKPIFDQIIQDTSEFSRQAVLDVRDQEIKHDTTKAITTLLMAYTKAYRAAIIGKNAEEITIISNKIVEKIEQTLNDNLATQRDNLNFLKGKNAAIQELHDKPSTIYRQNLADAERAEELAKEIAAGQKPANGKSWKPGTRPEKLSVVRRAQNLAKEVNNNEKVDNDAPDKDS